MGYNIVLFVLGLTFLLHTAQTIWMCTEDTQCSEIEGGVCNSGVCSCPIGKLPVAGGSMCVDLAPYHTAECVEEYQCARLFTAYECRKQNGSEVGHCHCQSGHHYFHGRCWPTSDYGEVCSNDEQCLSILRDPYSLSCNGTCGCAEGYYNRQRHECRKTALAVGDGCVINEDCRFNGGTCNPQTFSCYDINIGIPVVTPEAEEPISDSNTTEVHGAACSVIEPCDYPFECSNFGACVCPLGYYGSEDGTMCLAELGSPVTSNDQCVGLLAEVQNGICTCKVNFLFEENMRDCVKATRLITESCVTDENCFTFGAAARCGAPQEPWFLRTCECDPELSVWQADRDMCRLFAGIGESCEVDSDCMAGEFEITCALDESGQGYCACPENYIAVDGLCLTTGLELGDACQATQECTGTPNTACSAGICSCSDGYQEIDDACAPTIGGVCTFDEDCTIEHTYCRNESDVWTCRCAEQYIEHQSECWPVVEDYGSACNVTEQCVQSLGEYSECAEHVCACQTGHHHRSGGCWPMTGLFEDCSRTSQCYLPEWSERTVCRNGLCQCEFEYPYIEELGTCSGTTNVIGSFIIIITSVLYSIINN